MSSKLIVSGRWVLTDDNQWRLTIDPCIEVYMIENNKLKPASAFFLANLEMIESNRTFNSNEVTLADLNGETQRLTLSNLGNWSDTDGWDYEVYFLLEPTDLSKSNRVIFEAFVDEIEFDEDDEMIDIELIRRLNALKSPTSITCTQRAPRGCNVQPTH